ncbi:MAG: hypothetical protein ACOX9C_00495 [Kiritimatiellia bacterium]
MKTFHAFLGALLLLAGSAAGEIYVNLHWQTGAKGSNKLVIGSSPTTAETFTNAYTLHLAELAMDGDWSYTPERGYSPFKLVNAGTHSVVTNGIVAGVHRLLACEENSDLQFIMVLHEHATGRYFHLSETPGGGPIDVYDIGELDPTFPYFPDAFAYRPESSSGFFYKGTEIPPFCGWLAEHGLVEADLAGLDANLVNAAFAIGANPTNFTGLALSIDSVVFNSTSITGAFSFVARDGAHAATSVTNLNGDAMLLLVGSPTPGGDEDGLPASFDLGNGTFHCTDGATNATRFLRLKFAIPDVW